MLDQDEIVKIDAILQKYSYNKSSIIPIMQDIQKDYHYLPEEVLAYVAKHLNVSEAKIYGVATFYENFSLQPKGKYVIKVCDGTACHVRQSAPILEEFRKQLNVTAANPTTEDKMFTVETVSCLGACGLAPVVVIDGEVHGQMSPAKVEALLDKILKKEAGNE